MRQSFFEFRGRNSGIQNIYGLEIRIAREVSGENRRNNIPQGLFEYCFSKKVKKELNYPQILREDKLAACSSSFLNTELLLALYNMIMLGECGLLDMFTTDIIAIENGKKKSYCVRDMDGNIVHWEDIDRIKKQRSKIFVEWY